MCTVVILRRPDSPWPLLVAENRDEKSTRPSKVPGRHWASAPGIVAGLDLASPVRGSWLGVNDNHVFATLINSAGTTGTRGKKSRGDIVLRALRQPSAIAAKDHLMKLHADEYPSFFVVVADKKDAYCLKSDGTHIMMQTIPEGLSMITPKGLNEPDCPRHAFLQKFQEAAIPDPASRNWRAWTKLLAQPSTEGTFDAPTLAHPLKGMETLSSALLAFPASNMQDDIFLYANGKPGEKSYQPVSLQPAKQHGAHL